MQEEEYEGLEGRIYDSFDGLSETEVAQEIVRALNDYWHQFGCKDFRAWIEAEIITTEAEEQTADMFGAPPRQETTIIPHVRTNLCTKTALPPSLAVHITGADDLPQATLDYFLPKLRGSHAEPK